jgi:hypothetical protein
MAKKKKSKKPQRAKKSRSKRRKKNPSSSGGSMMTLRGGFKGAVGSLTGKKPKTKRGAILANVFWTVLTVVVVALLAYRIYQAF